MGEYGKFGWVLGVIAIVIAVIALVMTFGVSVDDGDTDAMSGLSASVSAQDHR